MKRLYCVPGGGTTSILFIRWQKLLGEEIKVEYLDIPGRGYLSKKPERESMRGIAEVMADVIEKKSADEPYLIFGYCFGAVAAYETCRVLKERGFHMPERLFVCGSYSPTPDKEIERILGCSRLRNEIQRMFYHMFPGFLFKDEKVQREVCSAYMKALYSIYDRKGVIEDVSADDKALAGLKGVDAESIEYIVELANNYFGNYVKDEKVLLSYCNDRSDKEKLPVPVTVIYGRDDDIIGDEWKKWQEFTDFEMTYHEIPFDHFCLVDDMDLILNIVADTEGVKNEQS